MEPLSPRRIALIDLDAFYASVEIVEDPSLKGHPVLIGGSASKRGVVAAASYEAREFGVKSAMPMSLALQYCPQAKVLPVRMSIYKKYSQQVMSLLQAVTPIVQQVSIDEAYLDVTNTTGSLAEALSIMIALQEKIKSEIGLPSSIGLATNRMMAKIACESGKPQGLLVVPPGEEPTFLENLPVRRLPGIGPKTSGKLISHGFTNLGQVARAEAPELISILGPRGASIQKQAQGHDHSSIRTERKRKSLSAEETFISDVSDALKLEESLSEITQSLSLFLNTHKLSARTVTLKLRFADFTTISRSISLTTATAQHDIIYANTLDLLTTHWTVGNRVRLVGVNLSNIVSRVPDGQLSFKGNGHG